MKDNGTARSLMGWVMVVITVVGILGLVAVDARAQHTEKLDGKLYLRQTMRKLWSDHVIWTREYIMASIAGTPDAPEALSRLLKNQEDIGYAMSFFYGVEWGKKFTEILKAHVGIAVEIIEAAKSADQAKLKETDQRWHMNADEMATFLSQANSYWRKKDIVSVLDRHMALTIEEVMARLQKNWKEDVAVFDKHFDQMMVMADGLADGIIKQFPAKL